MTLTEEEFEDYLFNKQDRKYIELDLFRMLDRGIVSSAVVLKVVGKLRRTVSDPLKKFEADCVELEEKIEDQERMKHLFEDKSVAGGGMHKHIAEREAMIAVYNWLLMSAQKYKRDLAAQDRFLHGLMGKICDKIIAEKGKVVESKEGQLGMKPEQTEFKAGPETKFGDKLNNTETRTDTEQTESGEAAEKNLEVVNKKAKLTLTHSFVDDESKEDLEIKHGAVSIPGGVKIKPKIKTKPGEQAKAKDTTKTNANTKVKPEDKVGPNIPAKSKNKTEPEAPSKLAKAPCRNQTVNETSDEVRVVSGEPQEPGAEGGARKGSTLKPEDLRFLEALYNAILESEEVMMKLMVKAVSEDVDQVELLQAVRQVRASCPFLTKKDAQSADVYWVFGKQKELNEARPKHPDQFGVLK